ncbi:MAG: hypothetical protein KDB40_03800 [Acidimicrobiales bacterium]|nr:hypothetical protein [Acidimicrobiales bacterium]
MRTRRRWGRSAILGTIGGLAVASAAAAGGLVPEDVGPAVDEGSVVIAAPDGTPLASGGSATPYTLVLPEGSTCPGDSANDDWRVQTFLIPASHDPGQVEYGVIGPEGTQFPLFAFDTKPYAHQLLPVNAGPGMEARIPLLPELTFTIFPPDAVAPGRYRIGVACTYFRQTARYWDAEIEIVADPDDEPAQFTWTAVDAPADAIAAQTLEPESRRWPYIAGAAALAIALGGGWWMVRRRSQNPPSSTSSRAGALR